MLGRYGIITSYLIDPLNQFINKIKDRNPNSIGFYYINDSFISKRFSDESLFDQYIISLFDINDNYPINSKSLEFMTEIKYYPLDKINQVNSTDESRSVQIFQPFLSIGLNKSWGISHNNSIVSRHDFVDFPNSLVNMIDDINKNKSQRDYVSLLYNLLANDNKINFDIINKVLIQININDINNFISYDIDASININKIEDFTRENQEELNKLTSSFTDLMRDTTFYIKYIYNISANQEFKFRDTSDIIVNDENISEISDSKLSDILVYIDSMRDSNGVSNNKYINYQNEIVKELSKRKNNEKYKNKK